MGQTLFVLSNLFAATISFLVADMTMRGREPWRQALASIVGFPVVVLAIILFLGTVGHLSAGTAVLLAGVVAVGMIGVHWGFFNPNVGDSTIGPAKHEGDASEEESLIWPISVALLGAFGGFWIARAYLSGTYFIDDDLSYHGSVAAHWLVDGGISLAPSNYHAYFPFNAEVLSLWFMLPISSDALASLSGLYWGLLTATAGFTLILAQGHSRTTAALSGALLLMSPVLLRAGKSFSAVDLAGPALILAAVVFAVPSPGNKAIRSKFGDSVYCGLLSGFAVGCKVSFAPVAIILFLWHTFGLRKNYQFGTRVLSATIYAVAAAATGTYWYVRNWLLTGNPLFPAEFGLFDGPFGVEDQARTKLVSWIAAYWTDLSFWVNLSKSHIDWPFGLFLLAAVGYGFALLSVLRHRRSTDPTGFAVTWLLVVIGLTLLFLYPFMPFSGTYNAPNAPLLISLRYLIASFSIGIILFGSQVARGHPHRSFWLCLAILAVVNSGWKAVPSTFVIMVAGATVLWLWEKVLAVFSFKRSRLAFQLAILPAALVVMAILTPYKQQLTDANIHNYGSIEHPIGRVWQAIENIPDGSSVAFFGPKTYQYYPIFGRKFQQIPHPVNGKGLPVRPVHENFRQKPSRRWWGPTGKTGKVDLSELVDNLIAGGVDYVLVTHRRGHEWPPQREALANSEYVQLIYDDGYSVIWRIHKMDAPGVGGTVPGDDR